MTDFSHSNLPDQRAMPPIGLKPVNVLQAAVRDLSLREEKKKGEADKEARYAFMNRHVHRARNATHLIALALFEPLRDADGIQRSDKHETQVIYYDSNLLRVTLINLLQGADEDALRRVEYVR